MGFLIDITIAVFQLLQWFLDLLSVAGVFWFCRETTSLSILGAIFTWRLISHPVLNNSVELTNTIVNEIADLEGADPLDLPALYDAIDSDKLEHLIDSAKDTAINVRFTYFGYNIDINGDREVRVRQNDAEGELKGIAD